MSNPEASRRDSLYGDPRIASLVSDTSFLNHCLQVERALVGAQAKHGLIASEPAAQVIAAIDAFKVDAEAMGAASIETGAPVAPLVSALRRRVSGNAAQFVHYGATTQDIADTAMTLIVRACLDIMEGDLATLRNALVQQVRQYRNTVMVSRSFLQHAQPSTFGLKCAGYLDALDRDAARLGQLRERIETVQLGGPGGTLAGQGDKGIAVMEAVAATLSLSSPALPWHGLRDRVVECGAWLVSVSGTLGKIAIDTQAMSQTEVGELVEPSAGTSSAMPHKRNPLMSSLVLAAVRKVQADQTVLAAAAIHPHERSLGAWHSEWLVLPEMLELSAGALQRVGRLVAGWRVDPDAMRRNLDLSGGAILSPRLSVALNERLGDDAAAVLERILERVANGDDLEAALTDAPELAGVFTPDEVHDLVDPSGYVGVADQLVERVLARRR